MAQRRLILASTSPYRRELLERLGVPFTTAAPDCDETPRPDEDAGALVQRLAEAKARSVAALGGDALVIGSDQVAVLGERILTKPGTHARALEQLEACSGRAVRFRTGLSVIDTRDHGDRTECVDYAVYFRELDRGEIERYLAAEAPYDCAGSIRSEGAAVALFERMEGSDPSSLIGLPLIRLAALLRAAGLRVP